MKNSIRGLVKQLFMLLFFTVVFLFMQWLILLSFLAVGSDLNAKLSWLFGDVVNYLKVGTPIALCAVVNAFMWVNTYMKQQTKPRREK